MNLPFTIAAFLQVFQDYNAAIWPVQTIALALGLIPLAALVWSREDLLRLALVALAALWALVGLGYHLMFFARINPVAPVFAALFVLQAVLFQASAIWPFDLRLRVGRDLQSAIGLGVVAYSVVIYPILGFWAGHGGMAGPLFGVAPCPTTIFTLGLLILAQGRWRLWLSVIPLLWSAIGLAAALQLGIAEDLGLPLAGTALVIVMVAAGLRDRRTKQGTRKITP
jgi:hypothetical protein